MRLAVINCKKTKKEYACSVREMYEGSSLFRNQLTLINSLYKGKWALISTEYGVVFPDDIIAPYDTTIYFPSVSIKEYLGDSKFVSTEPKRKEWGKKVAGSPIWKDKTYEGIDCWLSDLYWQNMFRQLRPSVPVRWIRPVVTGRGLGPAIKAQKELAHLMTPDLTAPKLTLENLIEQNLVYIATTIQPVLTSV